MSYNDISTVQMPEYISIVNSNGQKNKYSIEQYMTKSNALPTFSSKSIPLRRFAGGAVQNKYDEDEDEDTEGMEKNFIKSLYGTVSKSSVQSGGSSNIIELGSEYFTEQYGGRKNASPKKKVVNDDDDNDDDDNVITSDDNTEDYMMQFGGKGEALAIYRTYVEYVLKALKKKYGDDVKGGVPLQKLGGYYYKPIKSNHPNDDMSKLTEKAKEAFDKDGVDKAKKRYDDFVAEKRK